MLQLKQASWLLSTCIAGSEYNKQVCSGIVARSKAGIDTLVSSLVVVAGILQVIAGCTVGL